MSRPLPHPDNCGQHPIRWYAYCIFLHTATHAPDIGIAVPNKKTETVTFREYDFDDGLVLMTGKFGPNAGRSLDALKSQTSCCINEKVKAPDGSGSSGADSLFNRTL